MSSEAARRRAALRRRALRRDPHLWFLLAGLPVRTVQGVAENLDGVTLADSSSREAARTVLTLAYRNWSKSMVIGVMLIVPDAVVDEPWTKIIFGFVMWTPICVILTGIAQKILERTPDAGTRKARTRPSALRLLRWTPAAAAVVAAAIALTFP